MKVKDFNNILDNQITLCKDTLNYKGKEYALSEDRLKSFKDAGALLNLNPKLAAYAQLAKHLVSITDICHANEFININKLNEKFTDAINYLILIKALCIEYNKMFNNKETSNE